MVKRRNAIYDPGLLKCLETGAVQSGGEEVV